MTATVSLDKRTFDSPDETRPAGTGVAKIVNAGQIGLMHVTLPPGWRWSKDVDPVVRTGSCQAPHLVYVLSGSIHVKMDNGSESEFGPSDIGVVPPGHDAWTVGSEPVVYLDITGSNVWAKPS